VEAADPRDFIPESQCTGLQDIENISHYNPLGCRNNTQRYSTKINLRANMKHHLPRVFQCKHCGWQVNVELQMTTFHYLTLKINSLIHLEFTLAHASDGGGGWG
jgi:hypothetical protein